MDIEQWQSELDEAVKELSLIKQKCESEGREFNPKERERADKLLDKCDALELRIARAEGPSTASRNLINATKGNPYDQANGGRTHMKNNGPFESFGEQLQAIIRAGTHGQAVDPRLHEVRAASGLSEGIGADGGFLLQSDFSYDLIKGAFETGFLAAKTTRFTIGDNKNGIDLPAIDETSRVTGSRWGGIQLYHVDEAALKTKSKPKFRKLSLNLNKLVGLVYVTDELMWDVSALEQYITQGLQEEYGYMLDYLILRGSGAGQGLGVLNSGSLVTQSSEVGQAAATVNWDNIRKMWSRLLPKCRKNAVWCVGLDTEAELWNLSLAVGTGGSAIFQPATGASGGMFNTLMGRPVIPMEQASVLGTVGDLVLMDPSWIVMADKSIKTDVSIHVRFLEDEQILRQVYRYDLQPILASAITPASAGDTLSSHVALETRS